MVAATALVCLYLGLVALQPRWRVIHGKAGLGFSAFLDEYSNYDISFRVARVALSPPAAIAADASLYRFLGNNTNIPRSTRTDPVDIKLVRTLAPSAGARPNIFIFVIDSLRRDYLAPFNPAVTFTPNIAAFAGESVVARNAFTRYAGTGLSEPSIWSGALLLHKQYVTPFYPMNSLQKLLDADGYRQLITKDEILSTILAPSPHPL